MTSAQQLLHVLEQQREQYTSGQQLAKMLGISRAAVWKAIEVLRDQGHTIEGVSNRGYRLLSLSSLLEAEKLTALLPEYRIHVFDTLDSTNRYAKVLATQAGGEKALVVATSQSGGRGRLGRQFFSPRGGLYLSVLLPLAFNLEAAGLITSSAAVATARAMEEVCHKTCQIKWVNDLFYHGKKVCGILTEGVLGVESARLSAVVVGIGINLAVPLASFPLELADSATSLFDGPASLPPQFDAHVLVAALVRELEGLVFRLPDAAYLGEYRSRSLILGKRVEVLQGKNSYGAWAREIDDQARLVVETDDGLRQVLSSAEISIRLES
ncbi:biotin--[acetyl-CoA-carboxylase] ligase [Sphaerochaeta sp.]|uniref:biotin--[acetyl-CoA-carboxylase] ligase n=1 Tax=Sphaerochaeta sp. TaxID=1972642 RepID=UPI002FC8112E